MAFIKLLNAATATNSPPSGATAGFSLRGQQAGNSSSESGMRERDDAVFLLRSTAGSGTMTVTVKAWGYSSVSAAWHPMGTHATDATKGILNAGSAMGETSADGIVHSELLSGLSFFERIYIEITAIGGTSTAVSAWIVAP